MKDFRKPGYKPILYEVTKNVVARRKEIQEAVEKTELKAAKSEHNETASEHIYEEIKEVKSKKVKVSWK